MAESKVVNEQKETVQGKYYPVKPIDPKEVSIEQYLFDTNTILTEMNRNIKLLIQLIESKNEKKDTRRFRTIGITE